MGYKELMKMSEDATKRADELREAGQPYAAAEQDRIADVNGARARNANPEQWRRDVSGG